ncbi:phosphoenolpyruvate--protein phosphotransferase [Cryptosporangium phraense]|uniref:Phosphoenolpyruvate-protein phosphotransferase n=1 Tax=Cryptosporangium phraense TaxID=2593070 RepID=A0A545AI08_9ACTN|nr:phosphoenolpyruvate--protein phosphotransferase [Cryptosporangium phraense]
MGAASGGLAASGGVLGAAGALAASPGIVVGAVRQREAAGGGAEAARVAGEPEVERERLLAALGRAGAEVRRTRERVAGELGEAEAEIFDAHAMLLEDPELRSAAFDRIDDGAEAGAAWAAAVGEAETAWSALADPYLRARAADLAALRAQVVTALRTAAAGPTATAGAAGPAAVAGAGADAEGLVLVAEDLTPGEAVGLAGVVGVVLAAGAPTSHGVILLRSRGIPAVVAAGGGVLSLPDGTPIAFDGTTGELVVDPSPGVRARFVGERDSAAARASSAASRASLGAVTRDGVRIEVGANLGSVADARAAAANGADLAGLVRTEFLFLDRETAPDVDEQTAAYRALAEALGGRRLTLRTLDVGGDKPLRYAPVPPTANPFLSVRGLRFSLVRPDLFRAQLTAIVRVAVETPVTVLFPMVSTVDELRAARAALDDVLRAEQASPAGLRVGAMIEVPAAALKASALAPFVDVFSIGTNDLTQYTLAAARGDGGVAALGDPWDPGVLRLVDSVCRGASDRVTVSVCGEFAGDPGAASVLIGLGVRELSVAPARVPEVKQAVRELTAATATTTASAALAAPTASEARATALG